MLTDYIFLVVSLTLLTNSALMVVDTNPLLFLKLSEAPSDQMTESKAWTRDAIQKLWVERQRMSTTPIHIVIPPGLPNIQIVFKNESASPTGSLKHRYSWSLMMWALMEGNVKNGTHVFEASSGNTACSLAYMCKLLGLKFTAVVPDTIELSKVGRIENQGGSVVRVPISERLIIADRLAKMNDGFFMNQFKNAFHAEDFHESGESSKPSGNMMYELLRQLNDSAPDVFIHSAGTGGTISSIGRYIKKYALNTQMVLADTQFSVYFNYVLNGTFSKETESGQSLWKPPGMAGIGYGAMGPALMAKTTSLDPAVIDRVLKLPDVASTASMKVSRELGIDGGTSTGVNFLAALHIAAKMHKNGESAKRIATILADSGKYYDTTYYNRKWIGEKFKYLGGLETYDCWVTVIRNSYNNGTDPLEDGRDLCLVNLVNL